MKANCLFCLQQLTNLKKKKRKPSPFNENNLDKTINTKDIKQVGAVKKQGNDIILKQKGDKGKDKKVKDKKEKVKKDKKGKHENPPSEVTSPSEVTPPSEVNPSINITVSSLSTIAPSNVVLPIYAEMGFVQVPKIDVVLITDSDVLTIPSIESKEAVSNQAMVIDIRKFNNVCLRKPVLVNNTEFKMIKNNPLICTDKDVSKKKL